VANANGFSMDDVNEADARAADDAPDEPAHAYRANEAARGGEPSWVVDASDARAGVVRAHTADGWWMAEVVRDGCSHLWQAHNVPFFEADGREIPQDERRRRLAGNRMDHDYLHLCDLDGFERLLAGLIALRPPRT
jgi:hypothetical protein